MAGGALYITLVIPPLTAALESSMATHMLVQIPLLALVGALCAGALPVRIHNWLGCYNENGLPGILLTLFIAAYWMLPRALDGALASPTREAAKFLSLPLLLGLPLALSWRRLGPITKGLVYGNAVSMLGVAGWLYCAAPVRLCNYYRIDQQVLAGQGLLYAACALGLVGVVRVFITVR